MDKPDPFIKKSKLSITLHHQSQMLHGWFLIVCPSPGLLKYIKLICWPLAFTSYKAFLKNKSKSGTSLPSIPNFIFSYLTKFYWFSFFLEILNNICIVRVYHRSVWTAVYRFWAHLIWASKLGKTVNQIVKVTIFSGNTFPF